MTDYRDTVLIHEPLRQTLAHFDAALRAVADDSRRSCLGIRILTVLRAGSNGFVVNVRNEEIADAFRDSGLSRRAIDNIAIRSIRYTLSDGGPSATVVNVVSTTGPLFEELVGVGAEINRTGPVNVAAAITDSTRAWASRMTFFVGREVAAAEKGAQGIA